MIRNRPNAPTFASVVSNGNATTSNVNSKDELLTPAEMIQLTRDVMAAYKNCRTREEKFHAVSELAIKYVYGYGRP